LPVLRQISDAWLANKNTREKGFSLGLNNQKNGLSCDSPESLSIRGLQKKYRF